MAPASLDRLPTEILHMILVHLGVHYGNRLSEPPDAYFRGDWQQRDHPSWYSLQLQPLLTLCLVSRRLCSAIQPLLFSDFMLGYGDSWRSDRYTWDSRLTSFMRTVARRRDLAALVKRVYIHPYLMDTFDETKEVVPFDDTYYYGTSLSRLRRPQARQRVRDDDALDALQEIGDALALELQQLSPRDLVPVLIAELPNLERCSLRLNTCCHEFVRSAGLHGARVQCLHLKTIDVCLGASEAHKDRLFYLDQCIGTLLDVSARLETLNLHMCHGVAQTFPSLRNLKNLRLTYSRLGERDLEGLLSSCNGLRSFYYESTYRPVGGYETSNDGSDHFQLSNAVKCLSRHRATLESLHLDLRQRGHTQDPEHRHIFSFQEFAVLEHLFLNLEEFHTPSGAESSAEDSNILVQLLPPSIKSLSLAGCIQTEHFRLEESLLGLARASRSKFPLLEQIQCDENAKLDDESAIRDIFAAGGIGFRYNTWPHTEPTIPNPPRPPRLNTSSPLLFPMLTWQMWETFHEDDDL